MNIRSRAFTLLEILIAITVFSVVMMGMMATWKCIISGTQTGQAAAAAAQRARISIKTIEDALNNTEVSLLNIQFYSFVADTTSQKNFASLSVSARLPASFLDSGYFGDNVMRRVTFDVEKDDQGRQNLVMTQWPILAVPSPQYPPKSITLAKDLVFFGLEFWSPTEGDWLTEFTKTNEIPPMIRITLGVGRTSADPNIPYDVITRVVAMPVQAH
ncbi:MAG: prepilin-type N-terminal cleavage/methylation domain-containing protein [Verrucomicrobiota bacterium]|jgi:prepilin-type N-terminal cleavage/methylation domain-containing protein